VPGSWQRPKLSTNSLTSRFLPSVVAFSLPFPISQIGTNNSGTARDALIYEPNVLGKHRSMVFEGLSALGSRDKEPSMFRVKDFWSACTCKIVNNNYIKKFWGIF